MELDKSPTLNMVHYSEDASFDAGPQAFLWFTIFWHPIGVFAYALLIVASIRQGGLSNSSEILNLNIFVAEIATHVAAFTADLFNVGQSSNQISSQLCNISGIIILVCQGTAVLTLQAIALHRYSIVILRWRSLSTHKAFILIGCVYLFFITLFTLPALGMDDLFDPYRVSSIGGFCLINFRERTKIGQLCLTYFVVAVLAIGFSNMCYVYLSIYFQIRKTNQTLAMYGVSSMTPASHKNYSRRPSMAVMPRQPEPQSLVVSVSATSEGENADHRSSQRRRTNSTQSAETIILLRAVYVTGSFVVTWVPISSLIVYMLITGNMANWIFEGIAYSFVLLSSSLSPVFLMLVDSNYNAATKRLLGF